MMTDEQLLELMASPAGWPLPPDEGCARCLPVKREVASEHDGATGWILVGWLSENGDGSVDPFVFLEDDSCATYASFEHLLEAGWRPD